MDSEAEKVLVREVDAEVGVLSWERVVAIIVGILAVWWLVAWPISRWMHVNATFWEIGDAFAPVSGALSAAALYAVYASLHLQRREFKLQREELELARQALYEQSRELKASAEALTEQLQRMDAQRHVMEKSNEIAEYQALLDGYRLLDGARERAQRHVQAAAEYFERNIRPNTPRDEFIAVHAEFSDGLARGDRTCVRRLAVNKLQPDVASHCVQLSMTAIDARDAVEDAERLVGLVRSSAFGTTRTDSSAASTST